MDTSGGSLRDRPNRLLSCGVQYWFCVFFASYLLLLGPKGLEEISAVKILILYVSVLALVLLLAVLIAVSLIRRPVPRRFRDCLAPRALWNPANLFACAYLVFVLISALLSPWRRMALFSTENRENAFTEFLYVLCFVLISLWGKPTKTILYVVYGATGLFCLVILLHLLGLNPFGLYGAGKNFYSPVKGGRTKIFIGTVGNVDLVSAVFSLLLPICLVGGLTARGWRKLIGLALAAVCAVEMVKIRVLAGLVGVAAGGVLSAWILAPFRRKTKLYLLLGLGLAGAAGLAVLWGFDLKPKPLHELHEILHGRFSDKFGTGRFFIWRQMLERVPGRLLFGTGPDTVRQTGLDPFTRYNAAGQLVAVGRLSNAHCLPLQILYCNGLLSLLAWLGMVGSVLVPWALRKNKSRASAAIGAGIICFLTNMLFCITSVIIMPFFWCFLGLLNGEQINKDMPPE